VPARQLLQLSVEAPAAVQLTTMEVDPDDWISRWESSSSGSSDLGATWRAT
jgi:hypothetical protein